MSLYLFQKKYPCIRHMLSTVAYFKATATDCQSVIDKCNQIIHEDFGAMYRLGYLPDLLVVSLDSKQEIVGLLIMHFTESTMAWEVGTVSVRKGFSRDEILALCINGAQNAISVLQERGIINRVCWMVKRVKHTDPKSRSFFQKLGFSYPETWRENVLSDDGYVPFDPFDVTLMKKEVSVSE